MQEKPKRGTFIRDTADAGEPLFGYVFHVVFPKGETTLRVGYHVCTEYSAQHWVERYNRFNRKLFYADLSEIEIADHPGKQEADYYKSITEE